MLAEMPGGKGIGKFKQKYAYIDRPGKVVWQSPD
jgi:hypothetical protein